MVQNVPGAGPYLLRMMQWAVSKFRVSTEIESVLDQAIASAQQEMMQPKKPPPPDPKILIEAEKIKSNERIAMMETQSDEKVAALKATLELQKIEMQAKFDKMAAQYEQLMAMVGVNQQQAQMKDLSGSVNQLAQASVEGQQQNTAQMQQLLETISKKRKRVPVRNAMGDIIEVREEDDDDLAMVPGLQPPPMGMN
jgi:hypothetical protein